MSSSAHRARDVFRTDRRLEKINVHPYIRLLVKQRRKLPLMSPFFRNRDVFIVISRINSTILRPAMEIVMSTRRKRRNRRQESISVSTNVQKERIVVPIGRSTAVVDIGAGLRAVTAAVCISIQFTGSRRDWE